MCVQIHIMSTYTYVSTDTYVPVCFRHPEEHSQMVCTQPLECEGVGYVDLGVLRVSFRRSVIRLASQHRAEQSYIYAMEKNFVRKEE